MKNNKIKSLILIVTLLVAVIIPKPKLNATVIDDNVRLYRGDVTYNVYETIKVNDNDLENPPTYNDFVERWSESYTYGSIAVISIDTIYIEYVYNYYGVGYTGYLDSIVMKKHIYNGMEYDYTVETLFYYQGNQVYTFSINNLQLTGSIFHVISTLLDEYGDIKYNDGYTSGELAGSQAGYDDGYLAGEQVGYDNGYDDGYLAGEQVSYDNGYTAGEQVGYDNGYISGAQDAVGSIYYGGFSGHINPYTNEPYDETQSQPYKIGYNVGVQTNNDYSFTGLLFQVFAGVGAILTIELLPNITIGALVAVPVVFGIIYFILGKRSGE